MASHCIQDKVQTPITAYYTFLCLSLACLCFISGHFPSWLLLCSNHLNFFHFHWYSTLFQEHKPYHNRCYFYLKTILFLISLTNVFSSPRPYIRGFVFVPVPLRFLCLQTILMTCGTVSCITFRVWGNMREELSLMGDELLPEPHESCYLCHWP